MADEYVEPIGKVPSAHRVRDPGEPPRKESEHHGQINGEVIAVHRKAGHHEEGHLLYTSVGAQAYDEVVVRVEEKIADNLVGKRVSIHFIP